MILFITKDILNSRYVIKGKELSVKDHYILEELKNIQFYELKETKRVNLLISSQYWYQYVAPKIIRNKFQKLF
ncbi:hypothetical protein SAMN05421813_12433 [Daejeonella rubra]|uniref:Uncharacterized protein n=1 Tax=Daejeonella rubra TaxID=990371 RepID=A0A1G9WBI6_9SPHI|nr:hypothetical protein SAMN05421813_12433 [Daejeonella rubra]